MWRFLPYCMVITTLHTGSLISYVSGNLPDRLQCISLNSMGKIAKGVNKINFTMLYSNYCYIIIENFPKNSYRAQLLNIKFIRSKELCTSIFQRDIRHHTSIRLGLIRNSVGRQVRNPEKRNDEILRESFCFIFFIMKY